MADYYTRFSCYLDLGAADHIAPAVALFIEMAEGLLADDDVAIGFTCEAAPGKPGALWLCDDDGHGEPEYVIAFVLRCAEAFNLSGRWGFCWALTCSSPRSDGFGGGAQVLDLGRRKSLGWCDISQWLAEQLAAGD